MADVDNLRSRIQMMLSSRRTKRAEKQQEVEDSMQALGRRQDHFAEVAAKIFESIVEPRLKLLEEQLKDANYQRSSKTRGTLTLNRERRYAAPASLEMEIQCDQETRNLLVNYHLRIIRGEWIIPCRHGIRGRGRIPAMRLSLINPFQPAGQHHQSQGEPLEPLLWPL